MYVPWYWCRIKNFGDALNSELVSLLIHCKIFKSSVYRSKVSGIGSLLDNFLSERQEVSDELCIWGSGFGMPPVSDEEEFIRPFKCFAVRGELSKKRLENISGKSLDSVVVADPGLLANYLLDNEKIEKKYALGIIPHFADYGHPVFAKIREKVPGSIIIDINQPPRNFMKQVSECEAIAATAMHALIAADSLGIPNRWCRISEATTTRYKFHDYYSAFGIDEEPYLLLTADIDESFPEKIKNEYKISPNKVEVKRQQLVFALYLMRDYLEDDAEDMLKEFYIHKLRRLVISIVSCFIRDKKKRKLFRKRYK